MLNIPSGFGIVAYRFLLAGDPEEMLVTCGFDGTAGGPGQDLADDFYTALTTVLPASSLNNQYTFVGTTVRYNQSGVTNGALTPYEHVQPVAGTENVQTLPQNCAYLLRKTTAVAGRKGKGRMYWPPCFAGEAQVDARGVIESAALAGLTTTFNNLRTQMQLVANLVLLHSGPGAVLGDAPTPIVAFAMDPKIATRRLRMRP